MSGKRTKLKRFAFELRNQNLIGNNPNYKETPEYKKAWRRFKKDN
jgi:hypothetical protein